MTALWRSQSAYLCKSSSTAEGGGLRRRLPQDCTWPKMGWLVIDVADTEIDWDRVWSTSRASETEFWQRTRGARWGEVTLDSKLTGWGRVVGGLIENAENNNHAGWWIRTKFSSILIVICCDKRVQNATNKALWSLASHCDSSGTNHTNRGRHAVEHRTKAKARVKKSL